MPPSPAPPPPSFPTPLLRAQHLVTLLHNAVADAAAATAAANTADKTTASSGGGPPTAAAPLLGGAAAVAVLTAKQVQAEAVVVAARLEAIAREVPEVAGGCRSVGVEV